MRHADWKVHLAQYLGEIARAPFEPGVNDCALFAAGAVAAMTGLDLAADWRGKYRTLQEGLALLAAAGHADHTALAAKHFDEIEPVFGAPGDIAVVDGPEGATLGIFQGAGIYVLTTARLGVLPMAFAVRAFRVA